MGLVRQGKAYSKQADEYTADIAKNQLDHIAAARNIDPNASTVPIVRENDIYRDPLIKVAIARPLTPDMFEVPKLLQSQAEIARKIDALDTLSLKRDAGDTLLTQLEATDEVAAAMVRRQLAELPQLVIAFRHALGSHGTRIDGTGVETKQEVAEHGANLKTTLAALAKQRGLDESQYVRDKQHWVDSLASEQTTRLAGTDAEKQRRLYEAHPEYSWIKADIADAELLGKIEQLRSDIQRSAATYAQHRGTVDAVMKDLLLDSEALHLLDRQQKAYLSSASAMSSKMSYTSAPHLNELSAIAMRKHREYSLKTASLKERIALYEQAVRALLSGTTTPGDEATLGQYGYVTPAEQAHRDTLQRGATAYVLPLTVTSQLQPLLASAVPHAHAKLTEAQYNAIKAQVVPLVAQVMGLDVDRYATLPDEELALHAGELATMARTQEVVNKALATRHYTASDATIYTLRSDIVGHNVEDYNNRVSLLSALSEKARGAALLELLRRGMSVDGCFTADEATEVQTQDQQLAFIDTHKKIGETALGIHVAERAQILNPDTDYLRAKAIRLIPGATHESQARRILPHSYAILQKYPRAIEMNNGEGDDAMAAQIHKRLQSQNYRLAGWTMEEAEEKNFRGSKSQGSKPLESIDESIFRTIINYFLTPAGQTQTEDEFIAMTRDLSAGLGMEYGKTPPDELDAAREANMRGLREYKETMRLHYDYLVRKYGTSLSTLTLRDLVEHSDELDCDFASEQTHLNMALKMPGLFDLDKEENRDIVRKAEYLSLMGNSIRGLKETLVERSMTFEEIRGFCIEAAETDPNLIEAKKYLLEHATRLGLNTTGIPDYSQRVGERRRPA